MKKYTQRKPNLQKRLTREDLIEKTQIPEIFVGGLTSSTTEQDLRDAFSRFGAVKMIRLMYYRDGNPRGFAFVRLGDWSATQKALKPHSVYVDGKVVECKLALDKEQSKIHIEKEVQRRIYVKNIHEDIYDEDLRKYFGQFGKVVNIRIATTIHSNEPKGFAFITFESADTASYILNYPQKHQLKGAVLICNCAYVKSRTEDTRNSLPFEHSLWRPTFKSPKNPLDNLVFRKRKNPGHPHSAIHSAKLDSKNQLHTWSTTQFQLIDLNVEPELSNSIEIEGSKFKTSGVKKMILDLPVPCQDSWPKEFMFC